MRLSYTRADIDRTRFIGNFSGNRGGGIEATNGNEIEITQSVFANNSAHWEGGGFYSFGIDTPNSIWIINSVFANNLSFDGYSGDGNDYFGAGLRVYMPMLRIENSILWGNLSAHTNNQTPFVVLGDQLYFSGHHT